MTMPTQLQDKSLPRSWSMLSSAHHALDFVWRFEILIDSQPRFVVANRTSGETCHSHSRARLRFWRRKLSLYFASSFMTSWLGAHAASALPETLNRRVPEYRHRRNGRFAGASLITGPRATNVPWGCSTQNGFLAHRSDGNCIRIQLRKMTDRSSIKLVAIPIKLSETPATCPLSFVQSRQRGSARQRTRTADV